MPKPKTMKLTRINIDRESYGDTKGQYKGAMTYENETATVNVDLNHAVCIAILLAATDEIKHLAQIRVTDALNDMAGVFDPMSIDPDDK